MEYQKVKLTEEALKENPLYDGELQVLSTFENYYLVFKKEQFDKVFHANDIELIKTDSLTKPQIQWKH